MDIRSPIPYHEDTTSGHESSNNPTSPCRFLGSDFRPPMRAHGREGGERCWELYWYLHRSRPKELGWRMEGLHQNQSVPEPQETA